MKKNRMTEIFRDYEPEVQRLLDEIIFIEQQYITANLNTNSGALKEVREKIDEFIEEICKK
ncbi:MAG: hypothetical protein V9G20_24610 [Candidatus Promineifilaceae bacterium]